MPPRNAKTIKQIIFWQYAKIVSNSAMKRMSMYQ